MKRFFTFLNILELLSLSLFLLFSILYLFDLGRTTIGKIISDYLGDTILWLNFMYGGALELLTIPMLHYISVFSLSKSYFRDI